MAYVGVKPAGITNAAQVTVTGDATVNGAFTSQGIDDNADATAITIDSSENVGIGTSTPDEYVHIKGASGAATDVQIQGGDDTNSVRLFMGGSSNRLNGRIVYDVANNAMALSTNGDERLRVNSSGFVGIGESTPRKMVHITKNDSDGIIILDADGATTDHQIVFAKDYGTGGTSGGNYWGIGVDGSENRLVFAYDPNAQASLSADSKVVLTSNGQLAINNDGTFRSNEKLTVKNSTDTSAMWCTSASGSVNMLSMYRGSGQTFVGSVETTGSATQYVSASDHRLKENVVDLTGAIDRLKTLSPRRFNFIAEPDTTLDGFIAHEVTAVPEAVSGTHNAVDDDGNPKYQGLDASKIVPLLTGALQEAIVKIETLETQRADLEARLTALENA